MSKYDPPSGKQRRGERPVLIVTEGDSAKQFVVAGLPIVGRRGFGVYPLRGKVMNVRNFSEARQSQNRELHNLGIILGLRPGDVHTEESVGGLAFRNLVVVADQDPDGDHIVALLLNWMHFTHPGLLRLRPGFVQRLVTPLVRAVPKSGQDRSPVRFYSMLEYERWQQQATAEAAAGPRAARRVAHTVKYYKGLGTHTSVEARDHFKEYERHLVPLVYSGSACDEAILDFFDSKRTAERKLMLTTTYRPDNYIDYFREPSNSYADFLRTAVVHFSRYDLVRSMPRLADGMKPGQRKAMSFFIDKRVRAPLKVAQAGARAAEHSDYHHGETSMTKAIVCMAMERVGANNVALLFPEGQFGSRAAADCAANPRYIFTMLNEPICTSIFCAEDSAVLPRVIDDGRALEPVQYVPVVPMLAINGATGIGTGWRTYFPPHSPRGVLAACRALAAAAAAGCPIEDTPLEPVPIHFAGFTGRVEVEDASVRTHGHFEVDLAAATLTITELPVGGWTDGFVDWVREEHMQADAAPAGKRKRPTSADAEGADPPAAKALVRSIFNASGECDVRVELACDPEGLRALHARGGIPGAFRLTRAESLAHMWCFDGSDELVRIHDVRDLIRRFAEVRLSTYALRKEHVLRGKRAAILEADARMRFVRAVCSGEVEVRGVATDALVAQLGRLGYPRIAASGGAEPDFGYLMRLPVSAFTQERADELQARCRGMQEEVDAAERLVPAQMWQMDLVTFESALDAYVQAREVRAGGARYYAPAGPA